MQFHPVSLVALVISHYSAHASYEDKRHAEELKVLEWNPIVVWEVKLKNEVFTECTC